MSLTLSNTEATENVTVMDDSNAKVNSVDIGTKATMVTMTGTVTVGTQQAGLLTCNQRRTSSQEYQ